MGNKRFAGYARYFPEGYDQPHELVRIIDRDGDWFTIFRGDGDVKQVHLHDIGRVK